MRILIYIPVWKRPEITEVCYAGLYRLMRSAPDNFSFAPLIVSSTEEDTALALQYGLDYFETPNEPLGRKFNAGMEYALSTYAFDYVLQLNSDNLLSVKFWQAFTPFMEKEAPFFGVDWLYFYDSKTGQARKFRYGVGCGIRFLRRDVVERAGFVETRTGKKFDLWPDERNSGMDNESSALIATRTRVMEYFTRSDRPLVVDIKSDTNIHLFDEFKLAKRVEAKEKAQMLRDFPELGRIEHRLRK